MKARTAAGAAAIVHCYVGCCLLGDGPAGAASMYRYTDALMHRNIGGHRPGDAHGTAAVQKTKSEDCSWHAAGMPQRNSRVWPQRCDGRRYAPGSRDGARPACALQRPAKSGGRGGRGEWYQHTQRPLSPPTATHPPQAALHCRQPPPLTARRARARAGRQAGRPRASRYIRGTQTRVRACRGPATIVGRQGPRGYCP